MSRRVQAHPHTREELFLHRRPGQLPASSPRPRTGCPPGPLKGQCGGDTNQLDGVTNLSALEETASDGTLLRESKDHSEYLVPGTTSQHNIAATVAGLPDVRITGPNIGLGDALREAWDAF